MDRELIQDYLQRTGMKDAQTEALSRNMGQLATKDDLTNQIDAVRSELRVLEERVEKKLEALKAVLTWRMIAMTIFLATVMTLLNLYAQPEHVNAHSVSAYATFSGLRYIFRRYSPPTSNSACVIWPSEQTFTVSINSSNTLSPRRATAFKRSSASAERASLRP